MMTMGLPDEPRTRKEMYLNAMATGDSGGIPDAPVTREEMYLDAIAKGGGGGGGGGGSGVLIANVIFDEQTGMPSSLDKTMGDIIDAMPLAFMYAQQDNMHVFGLFEKYTVSDDGYSTEAASIPFVAASLDDYPVADF